MQFKVSSIAGSALILGLILGGSAAIVPEAVAAGSETVILNVDGMWAEGCEEYIADSLLADMKGIQEVSANHEQDFVSVDFDPAEVSAEQIAAAIEDCPHFDVTGSETHELDEELIEKSRRSRCHSGCQEREE
ncbi:MAG: heavy-metal-associated domain-containing protein [Thermoanaerobaculia bacterium]